MTQIKEKAVELIQNLPDEKMIYVINILENIEALSRVDTNKAEEALQRLEQYRSTLSSDFDYKKELAEARKEKYEDID